MRKTIDEPSSPFWSIFNQKCWVSNENCKVRPPPSGTSMRPVQRIQMVCIRDFQLIETVRSIVVVFVCLFE